MSSPRRSARSSFLRPDPARVRAAGLCREADALAADGRWAEAETLYRQALAFQPDLAEAHNNMGNALRSLGRPAEATGCYRAALACGLDHALVHYNLGSALRACGGAQVEAERSFRRALAMAPDYAEAWNNRANLQRDTRDLEESAVGYRRAVTLRPGWEDAHDNLSGALYLLYEGGQTATAARLARLWRRDHPGNPMARHIGAAIAGEATEGRASDEYVRQTFDLFAEEFDSTLAELGYRAPDLLIAVLRESLPIEGGLDILDAGCGTGLCAAGLRPFARRLTGVDLSRGMLERAQARNLYDRLEEAELGGFLDGMPMSFDLIVAADVLCYFGALDEVAAAAARALRPGGRLAFTVERLEGEEQGDGQGDRLPFRVNPHGRYAHREEHVRAALAAAGFAAPAILHDTLRQESGEPVAGLVVLARKG